MGASSPFARIAWWEPLDKALIWDPSDQSASLREPCDNCAFRPDSPEQADTAMWNELIAKLRAGGTFHCHKGVPIDRERPVIHGDQLHHEA
jgi:hypothetical protein